MQNIEKFKNDKTICEDLETKLDSLTDELLSAFDSNKQDIVWVPTPLITCISIKTCSACGAWEVLAQNSTDREI